MSTLYNENELFFNTPLCTGAKGEDKNKCSDNKTIHDRYINVLNKQSASKQRYDDIRSNSYREIQFTLNILVGIGLMSYYVYNLPKKITQ